MFLLRSEQSSSWGLRKHLCLLCSSWSHVLGNEMFSNYTYGQGEGKPRVYYEVFLNNFVSLSLKTSSFKWVFPRMRFLSNCMRKHGGCFLYFDRTLFYLHSLTSLLVPVTAWWSSYHQAQCSKVTLRPQSVSWWSSAVKWGNSLGTN